MRALAVDRKLEPVSFRHKRPCAQTDLAKLQHVPQVHPEGKGDVRVPKDALVDTWLRTSRGDLLCRLKEQLDRPAKLVAVVDQPVCNRKQCSRMAIMAAGVHHTLVL